MGNTTSNGNVFNFLANAVSVNFFNFYNSFNSL